MITALLAILFVFELGLAYYVYALYKRREDTEHILDEIVLAQRSLSEARAGVESELHAIEARTKDTLKKVNQAAHDVELEIKNSKETLSASIEDVLKVMAEQIEKPLHVLARKENSLEVVLRKVEREREALLQIVSRAQNLALFFNEKIPYKDLIKDIEYKKYEDARKMLAQGFSRERIERDLCLSSGELDLICGMQR